MTLQERAHAILRGNDRGGYSVPTARLYPFQWNWDSAFVAMGWATFDEARAWQEILSLLHGQWDDGMIPQILFEFTRIPMARDAWIGVVLRPVDRCAVGLAQPRRRLD